MSKIIRKLLGTSIAFVIFVPAGLLFVVVEMLYVVMFFIKLFGSIMVSLAMAAGAVFDSHMRDHIYMGDIIGTTKYLIAEDISEHLHNLRRASAFFARRH